MKNSVFVLMFLISGALSAQMPEPSTVDSLMRLNFEAFDQDMQGGWRYYSNQGHFTTAASLIETYVQRHPEMEENHRKVISWHAGQMLAMGGQNERAIPLMEASRKENNIMMWNEYLDATVAFLRKDRALFDRHFDKFKSATGNPNVRLLQILSNHFEKGYREALETAME